MFEQSLLVNDSMARKSGAFAASLSAQILFTGVLILIPLAYQEVMPLVKLSVPLVVPVVTPLPPPELPTQHTLLALPVRVPESMFSLPPDCADYVRAADRRCFDNAPPQCLKRGRRGSLICRSATCEHSPGYRGAA